MVQVYKLNINFLLLNIIFFPDPFFNHFIQSSSRPVSKLKSLNGVFKGQLPA